MEGRGRTDIEMIAYTHWVRACIFQFRGRLEKKTEIFVESRERARNFEFYLKPSEEHKNSFDRYKRLNFTNDRDLRKYLDNGTKGKDREREVS